MKTIQDARIRNVSIWFYIIAGLQLLSAFLLWQNGGGSFAAAAGGFAVLDILIGAAFVVLGYFAGQKHAWAFVAGLVLYVIRIVANFIQFFNPIALVLRLYLTFRLWQGLQACLALNRADQAMATLNQRRLVMPTSSPSASAGGAPVESSSMPVAQPWRPTGVSQPDADTP